MNEAYELRAFGRPFERVARDDPEPTGTEVVVEVDLCGVCHTDLHLQEGFYEGGEAGKIMLTDRGVRPPLVLGHEIVGRLIAAGPEARPAPGAIGRRFVIYPWIGCGACGACRRGRENLCASSRALGVFRPGGYQRRVVVPHLRYLLDAEGIDADVAATLACSGLTAFAALRRALALGAGGGDLLLIGMGGVGQSALRLARTMGFGRIAVADLNAGRCDAALRAGADLVLDPGRDNAGPSMTFAAAIDFVGSGRTADWSIGLLERGGVYVAVGLFGGELKLVMPRLILKAVTLVGSYVGSLAELEELLELVRNKGVIPVATEVRVWSELNNVLGQLRLGSINGRIILSVDAGS